MECGTIFKITGVYNLAVAICSVVPLHTISKNIIFKQRYIAVKNAIATAVHVDVTL
ncbi:MAG: hypothetical protein V7K81_18215 [Nostoc sp.]